MFTGREGVGRRERERDRERERGTYSIAGRYLIPIPFNQSTTPEEKENV